MGYLFVTTRRAKVVEDWQEGCSPRWGTDTVFDAIDGQRVRRSGTISLDVIKRDSMVEVTAHSLRCLPGSGDGVHHRSDTQIEQVEPSVSRARTLQYRCWGRRFSARPASGSDDISVSTFRVYLDTTPPTAERRHTRGRRRTWPRCRPVSVDGTPCVSSAFRSVRPAQCCLPSPIRRPPRSHSTRLPLVRRRTGSPRWCNW